MLATGCGRLKLRFKMNSLSKSWRLGCFTKNVIAALGMDKVLGVYTALREGKESFYSGRSREATTIKCSFEKDEPLTEEQNDYMATTLDVDANTIEMDCYRILSDEPFDATVLERILNQNVG